MEAPRALLAGRYRYQESLKVGSKAIVWLANDEQTGKTVVAAALPGSRAIGLQGLVGVEIPHVATIRDIIIKPNPAMIPSDSGSPVRAAAVAVADHVPGRTLHERLKKAKVTPHEVARWFSLLARGVDAIHAASGVHGAISARSIVTYPATGIAAPVLTHLVAPASGAYCAPERLQGGPPTAQGDVWALHATLFTAFTRATPFSGQTKEKLVIAMLGGDITPLSEFGIHDPELQEVIDRGLAPDEDTRRTNARELASALESWLGERDSEPDAAPSPVSMGPPSAVPSIPPSLDWDENAETVVSSEPDADTLVQMARDAMAERAARRPLPTPPPPPPANTASGDLPDATEDDDATVISKGLPFDLDSLPPEPPPSEAPEVGDTKVSPKLGAGQQMYDADDEDEAATVMLDRPLLDMPLPSFDLPSDDDKAAGVSAEAPPLGTLEVPSGEASENEERMTAPPISKILPDVGPEPEEELEDAISSSDPGRAVAPPLGSLPSEAEPKKSGKGLVLVLVLLLVAIAAAVVVVKRRELGLAPEPQPVVAPAPAPAPTPATTLEPSLDAGVAASDAEAAADALGGAAAEADAGTTEEPTPEDDAEATPAAASSEPAGSGPYKKPTNPKERTQCVVSHFEEGTFRSAQTFEFLCKEGDFRGINSQLHRSLVRSGSGFVTPGMKEWSNFGWFELAATAVLRTDCCPKGLGTVELPDLGKVCPDLDELLAKLFAKIPAPEEVSEYSKPYEKAVVCMYNANLRRPYRYEPRPMLANRFAFERFLMRASQYVHEDK